MLNVFQMCQEGGREVEIGLMSRLLTVNRRSNGLACYALALIYRYFV